MSTVSSGEIIKRIIEMVENVTEKPSGYLLDDNNKAREDVDLRRIVAYVANRKRGIVMADIADVFGCDTSNVGFWVRTAEKQRYGKPGYEKFTQAVDAVSEGINKVYPPTEGSPDGQTDSRLKKRIKKHKKLSKPRKPEAVEATTHKPVFRDSADGSSSGNINGHIMYALFVLTPVTVDQLAVAFGVTVDQAQNMLGAVFVSTKECGNGLNKAVGQLRAFVGQ
jgi:hypothetical protein